MSLVVHIIKNSPVDSNCYVLSHTGFHGCIIIDPGSSDCVELMTYLAQNSLSPQYIILTHEHFDHIGGVEVLRGKYKDVLLVASEMCSVAIGKPKLNMSIFYDGYGFAVHEADILTTKFRYIDWEGERIDFIASPGHTKGGICISVDGFIFSGDTMIYKLRTVTKLPGGSKEELSCSLKKIFSEFPESKKVFSGHGEPFLLKDVQVSDFL